MRLGFFLRAKRPKRSSGPAPSVFANGVWNDTPVWNDADIWKDAA